MDGETVVVRRSARRRKTVSAFREDGCTVVAIPSRFSRAEEDRWVRRMLARLAASERRRRPDADVLTTRAQDLAERYLDGRATPHAVTWVSNQGLRWGSCTPASGTIRISDRVQGMPGWVLDYVLLHELAHLIEPGHDEAFWALLQRYPQTERARGFLLGVTYAEHG
ncbi:M48 family metallopeptidase [Ruania halotolerans]|nr:M48 family metallopeptidase [Ruania halotolerans]UFU08425.1 M48 family metallopeptidase [Ruania halotolerans]